MSWRRIAVLALALFALGCAAPAGRSGSGTDGPRARCLDEPGRGESYGSSRPLIFLFCLESP